MKCREKLEIGRKRYQGNEDSTEHQKNVTLTKVQRPDMENRRT